MDSSIDISELASRIYFDPSYKNGKLARLVFDNIERAFNKNTGDYKKHKIRGWSKDQHMVNHLEKLNIKFLSSKYVLNKDNIYVLPKKEYHTNPLDDYDWSEKCYEIYLATDKESLLAVKVCKSEEEPVLYSITNEEKRFTINDYCNNKLIMLKILEMIVEIAALSDQLYMITFPTLAEQNKEELLKQKIDRISKSLE